MQLEIRLALPRDAASVPLIRHILRAALEGSGVALDCVSDVELAISEACTNVVLHAHGGSNRYEVQIVIGDEQVTLDVIDSGVGFGSGPSGVSMPDDDAHSGRGLALMNFFMDQAVFDSVTGGGGSVHLTKRLRWARAPAPFSAVPLQRPHIP
jgi:serine/threonine-protein kinase RsbW